MRRNDQNKRRDKTVGDEIVQEDKFSNLPDPPFYRILSFLELDDIARVGGLSNRLKERCSFLTSFKIDPNMLEDRKRQSGYLHFLDKVLKSFRNREIKSLHIPWFPHEDGIHVNEWINNAAKRCKLGKLIVDHTLEKQDKIVLPCCEFLKVMKLTLYDGTLEFPTMGFATLQVLTLISVEIVCDGFGKLLSSCNSLTRLKLENFSGVNKIEITNSSLQVISILKTNSDDLDHLKISANALKIMNVAWYFRSSTNKSFHLSAPSLESLTWRGDSIYHCDFVGNCKLLKDAYINLRHPCMLTQHLSTVDEALVHNSLWKLISSVREAQSLQLNCWQIEGLFSDRQPKSLDNLQDLVLKVSDFNKDCQVPATVSLLMLLPNIRTLKIKCCRQPLGTNVSNVMALEASSYEPGEWISCLELVEIELVGGGDEMQLVEYLLKCGKVLKKMTILYSILDVHRLSELASALRGFNKASSQVAMFFLPYY
ncbi:hypothetical protein L1049_023716 [Liquidambar formosana]|uniref:FBD domain-containing protein n=1 Tax=Liquidambar formosana TaxID=63359 RepID=A0AAP0RTT4_LIQFO